MVLERDGRGALGVGGAQGVAEEEFVIDPVLDVALASAELGGGGLAGSEDGGLGGAGDVVKGTAFVVRAVGGRARVVDELKFFAAGADVAAEGIGFIN